jgi:type II secretory pathway pseudopilin PulG
VLIAVAITTFILLSSVALLASASSAADAARQNTVAYNAARQVIENIRQYRGAPLPASTTQVYSLEQFGPVPQLQQLTSQRGGAGATGELRILPYRDTVKMVTVRVVWRSGDRGGKLRERTLTTLIAPEGVAR